METVRLLTGNLSRRAKGAGKDCGGGNSPAISAAVEDGDDDGVAPGAFQLEPVHSKTKTMVASPLDRLVASNTASGHAGSRNGDHGGDCESFPTRERKTGGKEMRLGCVHGGEGGDLYREVGRVVE